MIGEPPWHYRIIEKLGGGRIGVVYKASATLQLLVTLKLLPDEVADMSTRFKQH
jgi:hypothetical protein